MIRVVFMGSPEFAVPTLEALISDSRIEVCAVVTQPDTLAGRGKKLTPPPVKVCAEKHGIRCFQPEKLKTEAMYQALSAVVDMPSLIKERIPQICNDVDVDLLLSCVKPSKYDYRIYFKSGR